MTAWVEFWKAQEDTGGELPEWWPEVRHELRDWLEAQATVALCECDGAPPWRVNDDPTKAVTHRACGGLRSTERCIFGRYEGGHGDHPFRCRSTDERHITAAVQWLRYDRLALEMANEMSALRDGYAGRPISRS